MPQLLSDEGHEWVEELETSVQAGVESLLCRLLDRLGGAVVSHRLHCFDVDVAELVKPEVVGDVGSSHEVALFEGLVELGRSDVEFVEDPLLDEAFVSSGL